MPSKFYLMFLKALFDRDDRTVLMVPKTFAERAGQFLTRLAVEIFLLAVMTFAHWRNESKKKMNIRGHSIFYQK